MAITKDSLAEIISNLAPGSAQGSSVNGGDQGDSQTEGPLNAEEAAQRAKELEEKESRRQRDIQHAGAIADIGILKAKCEEYKELARTTEISAEQNKHSKPMIKRSIGYTLHMINY